MTCLHPSSADDQICENGLSHRLQKLSRRVGKVGSILSVQPRWRSRQRIKIFQSSLRYRSSQGKAGVPLNRELKQFGCFLMSLKSSNASRWFSRKTRDPVRKSLCSERCRILSRRCERLCVVNGFSSHLRQHDG